ncbi:hypothetical protein K1719_034789 [Acacia pycnantha]|nr:hypothetical protein K1719_034789 [Acacia pycnantha]
MVAQLQFCLTMIENGSIIGDLTFKSMHNIVHLDEKWFYMTKKNANYYLLPGEEEPLRTTKNKNFIGKVMFLVAVARPRFDSDGNETFSGKIGVFPLVTQEPTKRKSVNRPAGTLVTKPIVSVTKDVSRWFLIEHVVPAIKENEFCRVAIEDGFDIRLMNQPPNSPDLNILDLGFFNAIQSLQYKEVPKTTDDLIAAVVKSFESFSSVKSNKIFLTLQCCMVEILKKRGSNKYDLPHRRKEVMEKRGSLPNQIKCDPNLVEEVAEYRGEHVRRSVADMRETKYRSEGKDCYLFKISEEVVKIIMQLFIALGCQADLAYYLHMQKMIMLLIKILTPNLTCHMQCMPNCYARIMSMGAEESRIVLIAKSPMADPKLTYDYLFDPDERDELKVPCLCKAPNCRIELYSSGRRWIYINNLL